MLRYLPSFSLTPDFCTSTNFPERSAYNRGTYFHGLDHKTLVETPPDHGNGGNLAGEAFRLQVCWMGGVRS